MLAFGAGESCIAWHRRGGRGGTEPHWAGQGLAWGEGTNIPSPESSSLYNPTLDTAWAVCLAPLRRQGVGLGCLPAPLPEHDDDPLFNRPLGLCPAGPGWSWRQSPASSRSPACHA